MGIASLRVRDAARHLAMRRLRAWISPACPLCGERREGCCHECLPAPREGRLTRLTPTPLEASETSEAPETSDATLAVGSVGVYADAWRDAILAFKTGRRDVGDLCVDALALRCGPLVDDAFRAAAAAGRAALVGVPTTPGRRRERGFDGGLFLAEGLGLAWGLPTPTMLTLARRDRQRGRNRRERLAARGRFRLTSAAAAFLADARAADATVLLVDDVVTTGATLLDAADRLRAAGLAVAGAVTLARVPERRP